MLAFVVSFPLQSLAVMLAVSFPCFVAFTLGVLTARRRKAVDSQAVMTFSLAGAAMPTFVIGILPICVFSGECKSWTPSLGLPGDRCFPSFGRGETVKVGGLIAFSIITETVFQWPGVGQLFIQPVPFADIPVMAACLVMVSLLFVILNFLVDLLCATIDPRLRLDRARLGTAGG